MKILLGRNGKYMIEFNFRESAIAVGIWTAFFFLLIGWLIGISQASGNWEKAVGLRDQEIKELSDELRHRSGPKNSTGL